MKTFENKNLYELDLKYPKFLLLVATLSYCICTTASAGIFPDWLLGSENRAAISDIKLDESALRCMSCHDGATASDVTAVNGSAPFQISGMIDANHPVSMDYNENVFRKPQSYKSSATLNPDIVLVDGKVSCVSCHQLKTNKAEQIVTAQIELSNCSVSNVLTVGPNKTDLCLSCHIK